jgi:hypothetical protein
MASGADLLWRFRQQASQRTSRPSPRSMPNGSATSESNVTPHIGSNGNDNNNQNKDAYTVSSAMSRVVSPIAEYKYEPTNLLSSSIVPVDSIRAIRVAKPAPCETALAVQTASKIHIVVCTGSNCGSTRMGRTERASSEVEPAVWQPSHNQTQPLDDGHTATATRCCGVSATLLEIEELVQEVVSSSSSSSSPSSCSSADDDARVDCSATDSKQALIDVTSGGCVGHCSMGPTVSVLVYPPTKAMAESASTSATSRATNTDKSAGPTIHYFHQVNSVTACEHVVQAATALASDSEEKVDPMPCSLGIEASTGHLQEGTGSRNQQCLLMRRAQGLRWKALREMARDMARKSSARQGTTMPLLSSTSCASRDLLNQAMNAELAAVRPDQEKMIRAQRRHARFIAMLDQTDH